MLRLDMVILDEMGYLPFSQAGGALLDGDTPRVRCNDDHDGRW